MQLPFLFLFFSPEPAFISVAFYRISGSDPARNGDGRDDVVEKARRERANREKLRACRVHVVLIQRWYRGRWMAASAREKERADWDRKLSDFGKLQRTLVSR